MSSIEFKTFQLRELKAVGDDGTFEGYASVFGNADCYDDVVERGAFTKTISEQSGNVPILWQHNPYEPIGLSLELDEDRTGLHTRGQLNLDTQRGREAYSLLKQGEAAGGGGRGPLKGLSIGYQTIKFAMDGAIRRLKEIKLWEYSLVTFPANELAIVNAVKSAGGAGWLEQLAALAAPLAKGVVAFGDLELADREHAWDAGEAVQRLEKWAADSDGDLDAAKFARAFCWYDSSSPDTDRDDGYPDAVDAYKLPIADVVDGQLRAIPRAIFAAAGVLSGARGGADIPADDQARIRSNLTRYYAKMRREFDDESIVAPWESDGKWSVPVLDLKEGRTLSKQTRDVLAAAAEHALAAHMTLQALLDMEPGDMPTPEPGAAPDEDTVKETVTAFAKSIGPAGGDVAETFAAFAESIKTT